MCNGKGWFMRMVPFVATFAIGVFIASFFVSINAPNFRGGYGKRHEMKRLRMENERLKNENLRLKNELENQNWSAPHALHPGHDEWNAPNVHVPVPIPPAPPLPPVGHRFGR